MISEYHGEEPIRTPKTTVVTGAAGFIGSHLVDQLLAEGCQVTGIDNFDPWYDPAHKRRNLVSATTHPRFRLVEADISSPDMASTDLAHHFSDVDVVFHLAARPGVQQSWGSGFQDTCRLNITMTQQVLEAAAASGVGRLVNASSSSVYGNGATTGSRSVDPVSPYGVSKAAGEQLSRVYGHLGLDVVNLRYFTVFGPRQRPDMAIERLLAATAPRHEKAPFTRRGPGTQMREFTFVADVVAATVAAGLSPHPGLAGATLDVGGGCAVSLNEVISTVTAVTGTAPMVVDGPTAPGDPTATAADIAPTADLLRWRPTTSLLDGIRQQWDWHRQHRGGQDEVAAAA
jgi:nucleoside-diphosphate-sugar epimerase